MAEQSLGQTTSLCPVCLQRIPATYLAVDGNVYLAKSCPEHGSWRTILWQGAPDFTAWQVPPSNDKPPIADHPTIDGCPYDCGLCPNHQQQACCVLIELTNRCNQHCAFCFADSGGKEIDEWTLPELKTLFQRLLERSPQRPFNIQLSGGEPTLREDLPEIIALAKSLGFPYVQVNTNGRRLAQQPDYAAQLAQAGLDCVFLQFDGTKDEIYQKLRNEPLLEKKEAAIAQAAAANIGVVLVVTVVPGVNDDNLGDIVSFTADHLPGVRGIHLQPVSYFGRFPTPPQDEQRITIPRLLQKLTEQPAGEMETTDFVPLMTGHARCSFHGNFIALPKGYQGLSQKSASCCDDHSIEKARNYLAKKWSAAPRSNPVSDSRSFAAAEWDALLEQLHHRSFSITAMAFQDVWNIDLARLCRCRLHVATRDLRLIPFCAYNLTDQAGRSLYRHQKEKLVCSQ